MLLLTKYKHDSSDIFIDSDKEVRFSRVIPIFLHDLTSNIPIVMSLHQIANKFHGGLLDSWKLLQMEILS